ncbi:MAG: hypothetical protein ACJ705_02595 [Nitrososphaeraceae archaeon]|jgi:hypothetical protein
MHIVVSFSRLSIIVILTLTLTMIEYQSAAAAAAADANTLDSQSPNDKGGLSTINDFI